MSRLRVGSAWLGVLVLVAALVSAGLVIGNRNDAEASQIRADAQALSRTSAHEQAVRQLAAAEAVARRQAAADRAEARRAARERKIAEAKQAAEEQAAREQAAARRAARQQAAQERAARRQAAAAAAAAAAVAAAGHDLTGSMTEPDTGGALVTLVGGHPGQSPSELGPAARTKLGRLMDQLRAGRTFACPAGSGGDYDDIVAGAPVTVRDGTGAVLARTGLTGGTLSKLGCTFAFRTHVPDADSYQVEVGRRGALTFSRAQLDKQRWSMAGRL